jgi:hypothetical protein
MGIVDTIKRKVIKEKAKEFLGDNVEIVDDGNGILVKIKHDRFEVEIQGIKVVFVCDYPQGHELVV